MKRLVLINPVGRKSGFLLSKISRFPPLSLAYVAAVTPKEWDVKIIDENFEPCTYDEADLVGITAFTSNIGRAYEIASEYRRLGIPVVMGGIHASMLPDEALKYCDAVVVGEVEGIWSKVLADFETNKMAGAYHGPHIDLEHFNILPRRDLLHPGYLWQTIQTSRGCPFDCSFCSVSRYLGRRYRQRTAESVLEELSSLPGKYVLFLDDNLVGYSEENHRRALAIFDGMIERGMKKTWWMQASINVADDDYLLKRAAASGCSHVLIGFETTVKNDLVNMHKAINLKTGVENYGDVVQRLHRHNIAVMGAFIIGNDYETFDSYRNLANFIVDNDIDIVQISILTPLPGTEYMKLVVSEDRLLYDSFPDDWKKFRFSYLVHSPVGVTKDLVYKGNNYIKRYIYTFPIYHYRLIKSFFNLKCFISFYIVYKMNKALKKGWINSHYFK